MNPQHVLSLRKARCLAGEMSLEDLMALLLYYGSHARWTGVEALRKVRNMEQTLDNQAKANAAPAKTAEQELRSLIVACHQPQAEAVVDLMATYAKVAGLIEREILNLRAILRPDVDPAVPQSLRTIAELLDAMKQAETDARQALGAGLGQAHGQAHG